MRNKCSMRTWVMGCVFLLTIFFSCFADAQTPLPLTNPKSTNPTLFQYFEWNLPTNGKHWRQLKEDANHLSELGITGVWLPPASKGTEGKRSVGYDLYDFYDLGEFFQRGSTRTKYGTKQELQVAIAELHKQGIAAYADVVMGQLHGSMGDEETVMASEVDPWNRWQLISSAKPIQVYTKLTYPARQQRYSSFTWDASKFTGIDYSLDDAKYGQQAMYLFQGKTWNPNTGSELGNYDFLLGTDIDHAVPAVRSELIEWGKWLTDTLNLDGYRIDAAKHMDYTFIQEWVRAMRAHAKRPLFVFSEYVANNEELTSYLKYNQFDQLVYDFEMAPVFKQLMYGHLDLRKMRDHSLAMVYPHHVISKVNMHDMQPDQVGDHMYIKPKWQAMAYAYILTRSEGIPLVFYGDYYGIRSLQYKGISQQLDVLLKARKDHAYGVQRDYFDDADLVGWTREGEDNRPESGLAAVLSDGLSGGKWMYVGKSHALETWRDLTGKQKSVTITSLGWGYFEVGSQSYAVYVPMKKSKGSKQTIWIENGGFKPKSVEIKNQHGTASFSSFVNEKGYWRISISANEFFRIRGANGEWMNIQEPAFDTSQTKQASIQAMPHASNDWVMCNISDCTVEQGWIHAGKPRKQQALRVYYESNEPTVLSYQSTNSTWKRIPMTPLIGRVGIQTAVIPEQGPFVARFISQTNPKQIDDRNGIGYPLHVRDRDTNANAVWVSPSMQTRCDADCLARFALAEIVQFQSDKDSSFLAEYQIDNGPILRADIASTARFSVQRTLRIRLAQSDANPAVFGAWVTCKPGLYVIATTKDSIPTITPPSAKHATMYRKARNDHQNQSGYLFLEWTPVPEATSYRVYRNGMFVQEVTQGAYAQWFFPFQGDLDLKKEVITIRSVIGDTESTHEIRAESVAKRSFF